MHQNYFESWEKYLLLFLGFFLLTVVSSSLLPAFLVLIICLITFILMRIIGHLDSQPILTSIKCLAVPIGFALIITFYAFGFIGTLTGTVNADENSFSIIFLALPFYLLSASALISDAANDQEINGNLPSFLDVMLYITLPFKLLAGPLEAPNMMAQFYAIHFKPSTARLLVGFSWIVLGLFMKFVIADRLSARELLSSTDPIVSIICAFIFELKFYFDFAGYSFIAYGLALLVNLKLTINFNHPFTTDNVVEFWRNWHITLGQFLKKYIYLMNKHHLPDRHTTILFAAMIFTISAMWHGGTINYLLWGLFHGAVYYIYLMLIKYHRIPKIVGWSAMICFFIFGRMLAIDADYGRLLERLGNLIKISAYLHPVKLIDWRGLIGTVHYKALIMALIFISLEFIQVKMQSKTQYHLFRRPIPILILLVLFVFFGTHSGELLYARL